MKIERFEDIKAWQHARELARMVYAITNRPDFCKDFGLSRQIRDASGSVMHNIAEGFDGRSSREFVRFLGYAKRSCTEVQSELYLALDAQYIDGNEFARLYEKAKETRAVIHGFIDYLESYQKLSS